MTPGIEPGTTGASPEVNTNYTTAAILTSRLLTTIFLSPGSRWSLLTTLQSIATADGAIFVPSNFSHE
eukprot:scaffold421328_cov48-Attheya_sp.AAC.1